MKRYVGVSGAIFLLVACVQLLRVLFRWRVTIAGLEIPLWASAIAALVAVSLAIWAFRVNARASQTGAW